MTEIGSLVKYDQYTGGFSWGVTRGKYKEGSPAGHVSKAGYVVLFIDGKKYYGHRVAFYLMTGRWPNQIDHINCVKNDNRWCNLRECTHKENSSNRSAIKSNSFGYKGVQKQYHKYRSFISCGGKQIYIGMYKTVEEAARAYDEKAKQLFGEFAKLNFEGV